MEEERIEEGKAKQNVRGRDTLAIERDKRKAARDNGHLTEIGIVGTYGTKKSEIVKPGNPAGISITKPPRSKISYGITLFNEDGSINRIERNLFGVVEAGLAQKLVALPLDTIEKSLFQRHPVFGLKPIALKETYGVIDSKSLKIEKGKITVC